MCSAASMRVAAGARTWSLIPQKSFPATLSRSLIPEFGSTANEMKRWFSFGEIGVSPCSCMSVKTGAFWSPATDEEALNRRIS
jgi:hypothetical protein